MHRLMEFPIAATINWLACLLNIFLCIVNYRGFRRLRAQSRRMINISLNDLTCPCCQGTTWIDGPEGGMCQNVECANCHVRFNHTPFGLDWIGHRSDDHTPYMDMREDIDMREAESVIQEPEQVEPPHTQRRIKLNP